MNNGRTGSFELKATIGLAGAFTLFSIIALILMKVL